MSRDFFSVSGKERQVKVAKRGIASLVTYAGTREAGRLNKDKNKYVWPSALDMDSRFLSKRIYGNKAW